MEDASLIYEFEYEDESKRDDFGLICSSCKAGIYCDSKEAADYQRSISYFCYSCGARFLNTGGKNVKKG